MNENEQQFLINFVVQPIQNQIESVERRLGERIGSVEQKVDQFPTAIAAHAAACQAQRDREDRIEADATGTHPTSAAADEAPEGRPSWPARALAVVPTWLRLLIILALGALAGGGAVSGITVDLAEGQVHLDTSQSRPAAAPSTPSTPDGDPDVDAGPDPVRQQL